MNSDEKLIDVLQKNGLHQHITILTRQRGDDKPHVLDLVITSGDIVSTLEYWSPLGKSDHWIISFECQVDVPKVTRSSRFNYQKGEFDELRAFLNRDWDQTLSPDDNDLDDMWAILKSILLDDMERYIPKTKNMTTLKCSTLQPFNSDIKQQ